MAVYILKFRLRLTWIMLIIVIDQGLTVFSAVINAAIINTLVARQLRQFLLSVALLLIDWLVIAFLQYNEIVLQEKFIQDVDIAIREDVVAVVNQENYENFHQNDSGTYESWINNDIQQINTQGLTPFFQVLSGIAGTSFALVVLTAYQWTLMLTALIFATLIILLPKVLDRQLTRVNQALTQENERFVSQTEDVFKAFDLLYSFQALNVLHGTVKRAGKRLKTAYVDKAKVQSGILTMGFLGNILSQVILIGQAGYLAFLNLVSIGTLNAVASLSGNIFNALGNMSNNLGMIRGTKPIFEKYRRARQKTISQKPQVVPLSPHQKTAEMAIQVDQLSYGYGRQPVFQHLSCAFKAGHKYLILGSSGSGKSTFLKVIAGYHSGYHGRVFINGQNLKKISPAQLNQQLLYLDQRPQFLNQSIRQNLRLGNQYSDEEMVQMLKRVYLVSSTQEGRAFLDRHLGEEGQTLSGGQLQRLALARGLLRQASIILLDEGTSAIDRPTAVRLERQLLDDPKLTLLMVSHTPHQELISDYDAVLQFADLANHNCVDQAYGF